MSLKVNYLDDVLTADMGGKRRYRLEQNEDGTVSIKDMSTYAQIGDSFGAEEINQICTRINQIVDALNGYSLRIVDAKPAVQEEGVIYFVRKAGS